MASRLDPDPCARLALVALVAVVALAPWPFGAVQPPVLRALTAFALATVVLALVSGALRGAVRLPSVPLWPFAAYLGVAAFQLVPLPERLHSLLAPGSAAVWHPGETAAAAVLGDGLRPVSVDPRTTLMAVALVGALGMLAVLAAPALGRDAAATRAVGVVGVAGFVLAAYAVFARARFGVLLYGRIAVPTVSPFGPFVNKNHFAGWVAMGSLLVAGLALGLAAEARACRREWTAGRRAVGVTLAVVASLAMALAGLASLSRGGAAALAGGALVLLALRLPRRGHFRPGPSLVAAAAGALALAALLLALSPPEARGRLQTLSGASFRLDTWRDALRLAATSPVVGHGLGAFHDAFPRFKQANGFVRVEHAENDYLETLAETGVAGLTLALAGVVLLLRAARRRPPSSSGHALGGIAAGATAALAALAVHSLFDFDLRIPASAALAALATSTIAARAGERARRLSRTAALALAAAAALVLAAVASPTGRPWVAAREEVRLAAAAPTPAVRTLRLARAKAALVAVVRERPAHAESWLMLAGIRAADGDPIGASALARHALWLDPERPELRAAARRLMAGAMGNDARGEP